MTVSEKPILLLGGGIDGYAVLLYLKSVGIDFKCLHVHYGQIAAEAEISACKEQCEANGVQLLLDHDKSNLIRGFNREGSLLFGDENKSPELHGRNMVLLLHAAKYSNDVWLGLDKPYNNAQPFFDCTKAYVQLVVQLLDKDIEVYTPNIDKDKLEICREAYLLDNKFFDRTMTCWNPIYTASGYYECGSCKHCQTKYELKRKVVSGEK